ncbi:MAG: multidrug transporter [Pseudomonas sp.]|nr:multidrug transporter [Pseudomonas sp.]
MPLGIVLLLVWLFLLLRYPRIMLPASGVVVGLALLLAAFVGIQQWQNNQHLDQLHISIDYQPENCEFGKPLHAVINNRSDLTASNIQWQLIATQAGQQRNLLDISVAGGNYRMDDPLAPGDTWQQCFSVPPVRSGYRAPDLIFRAADPSANFHD